jgi:hypothetical protein
LLAINGFTKLHTPRLFAANARLLAIGRLEKCGSGSGIEWPDNPGFPARETDSEKKGPGDGDRANEKIRAAA